MGSNTHSQMRTPLILTALGAVLVFILASKIEFFEYLYKLTRAHNDYELDELVAVVIYLWFVFGLLCYRWARHLSRAKEEMARTNEQLREALSQIKTLEGLLPICANCKKIRTGDSTWQPIETYISQHSEATFSHSICPECARKLYPDLIKKDDNPETARP